MLCERVRWAGAAPTCPHCGGQSCYFLRPADGVGRRTHSGRRSARRVWKCGSCRRQFSALTGTILQSAKLPLPVWVAIAAAWEDDRTVPAAGELMRRFGLSGDAARRASRILLAAGSAGPPGLSTLLGVSGTRAAHIRDEAAVRRAPRPQVGPSAEYGS
ncbi:MAG TPA: transposase [Jatrophihabitans sp.]|nr:transposase [Jatrophihabitans sp.]